MMNKQRGGREEDSPGVSGHTLVLGLACLRAGLTVGEKETNEISALVISGL